MRSILVIESHLELRRFVTAMLARAGHQTLAADSVQNAAAFLLGGRIEVVVTDLVHDALGTQEEFADLRQEHPELEVVALSEAAQSAGYLRLAALLGAEPRLVQPFMSEALIELTRPRYEWNSERRSPRHQLMHRGISSRHRGMSDTDLR